MGIFEKFKKGFQKSATNLASGFKNIILKKEIDDIDLDKIEDFLISSDVGRVLSFIIAMSFVTSILEITVVC